MESRHIATFRPGVFNGEDVMFAILTFHAKVCLDPERVACESFIRFCAKAGLKVRRLIKRHLPYITGIGGNKNELLANLKDDLAGAEDAILSELVDWYEAGKHKRFDDREDVKDMMSGRFAFALRPMIREICTYGFDRPLPVMEHNFKDIGAWTNNVLEDMVRGFVTGVHLVPTLTLLKRLRKNPRDRQTLLPCTAKGVHEFKMVTRFAILAEEGGLWVPRLWISPFELRKRSQTDQVSMDLMTVYFALRSDRDAWREDREAFGPMTHVLPSERYKIERPMNFEEVDPVLSADEELKSVVFD